jgi:hypothetical protein
LITNQITVFVVEDSFEFIPWSKNSLGQNLVGTGGRGPLLWCLDSSVLRLDESARNVNLDDFEKRVDELVFEIAASKK